MLTIADLKLPAGYNGQGMHYDADPLKSQGEYDNDPWYRARIREDFELMRQMNITVLVVLDARDYIYQLGAEFGMLIVNRPFRRMDEPFTNDGAPVQTAHRNGAAAFPVLENEALLAVEYDGRGVNLDVASDLLISASIQIYDMGGIVCWQPFDFEYVEFCLWKLERAGRMDILDRFMVALHLYGINHPPDYTQDENGFLGFKFWARFFQHRIGFIPLMIVSEWGWGLNESADNRFLPVSEDLRQQYEMACYDSLKTGVLPDGTLLKDWPEVLGICKWIFHARGKSDWFDDAIVKEDGSYRQEFVDAMVARGPFVLATLNDVQPEPLPDPQPDPQPTPDPVPDPVPLPAAQRIPDELWNPAQIVPVDGAKWKIIKLELLNPCDNHMMGVCFVETRGKNGQPVSNVPIHFQAGPEYAFDVFSGEKGPGLTEFAMSNPMDMAVWLGAPGESDRAVHLENLHLFDDDMVPESYRICASSGDEGNAPKHVSYRVVFQEVDPAPQPEPEPEPIPEPEEEENTMPEFQWGFKKRYDEDPELVGEATSDQIDIIPGVFGFQMAEHGIMIYIAGSPAKFFKQSLPKP